MASGGFRNWTPTPTVRGRYSPSPLPTPTYSNSLKRRSLLPFLHGGATTTLSPAGSENWRIYSAARALRLPSIVCLFSAWCGEEGYQENYSTSTAIEACQSARGGECRIAGTGEGSAGRTQQRPRAYRWRHGNCGCKGSPHPSHHH